MWKITLSFLVHRVLLYGVSLAVLTFVAASKERASVLPPFASLPSLNTKLIEKVAELKEVQAISAAKNLPLWSLISQGSHPFLVLGTMFHRWLPLRAEIVAILLSNIFFLLLLRELFVLISRISSEETAGLAGIFLVFWPTSYESSMGSAYAADAFFILWAVRTAVDDKWYFCGLALLFAGLCFIPSLAILPLILAWFWFYSRHYQWLPFARRALYVIIPVAVVVALQWKELQIYPWYSQSALASLVSGVQQSQLKWTLSQSMAGQTLSILVVGIGAGIAAATNFSLLNKSIPIYFFLFWMVFSPYGTLASRVLFAGTCFQGLANASSSPLTKVILSLFFSAGVYEIFSVFS